MKDLHDFAIMNLLQVGRGGCRSTSPTNNLCMQLVAEAWTALAADTNMGK